MLFGRITVLLALISGITVHADETVSLATADNSIVAAIAKTPKGLLADSWDIRVGGESTKLSGFRAFLNNRKNDFVRAEWEMTDSRVKVRHFLSDGSSFVGEAEIDEEAKLLQVRFTELDAVSIIQSGCLTGEVERLYSDIGWVIERPTKKHRRRRLMTSFILTDRDTGWTELVACKMGDGYEFDPETKRCVMVSMRSIPEALFTIGLAKDGDVVDLVRRYRTTLDVKAPKTIEKVACRYLFDDWSGTPTRFLIDQLRQLEYAGCDRLYVLFHVWQKYGYDQKYPDVFPPNELVGGVEGIRRLAEYCKDREIPFGLHDNYSDFYPDAPSFDLDLTTSYVDGKGERQYHRGWFNKRTGIRAHHFAAEPALDFAAANFKKMREAFPLTTIFLDVTTYSEPFPYESPPGVFHDTAESLHYRRKLYDMARETFGGVPVIGEGAIEKYLGCLDAAGSDLWSEDRWNIDPGAADWEYYPLFNIAFHKDIILYGAGYQTRYKLPEADYRFDHYSEAVCDDYRATRILMGNSGFRYQPNINQLTDTPWHIREYYLSVPLAERIERVPITEVNWADNDMHRPIVRYENDVTVRVNRSDRPWHVDAVTLPQHGVLVKGDDFLQATLALYTGRVDLVMTKSLFYFDARGRTNSYAGVTTDGALIMDIADDSITIRPLHNVRWLYIDFDKFPAARDVKGATVEVRGFEHELIDTLKIAEDKNTFEQSPQWTILENVAKFPIPMKPAGFYPHYVVKTN